MRYRLNRLLRQEQSIIPIEDYRTRLSVIADIADYLIDNGVIVPPCKVGDMVYVGKLHTTVDEIIVGKDLNFMCFFDCDWVMDNVGCGDCPFASWHTTYEGDVDCQTYGCFSFTEKDIGKTVFLTKEEAEQALKGAEGK